MGGAVSAGENNDDLIDNLVAAKYITSEETEEIFRAVDRGLYYLPNYKDSAYHDLAWRHQHLHISAPCIYSKVMSSLNLKPGLSFLNIGSGTGYLSTMVGLALGICGVNHGIELYEDVVEYARMKVQEFALESPSFDRYTFCEPQFVIGNCLDISPESPGYDRVYCGAACPVEYKSFMKNLLNISGLLIMPCNEQLQVITRTGQTSWETENILVVNFASLIVPSNEEKNNVVFLPNRLPPSLSSLCRSCIRQVVSSKYHSGSNRRFPKQNKTHLISESFETSTNLVYRRYGANASSSESSDSDSDRVRFLRRERAHRRRFSDSDSDSDLFYPDRRPRKRRSKILNIVTNTITTVGRKRGSSSRKNNEGKASTSTNTTADDSSQVAPKQADSSDEEGGDDRPSTSKLSRKKKSKKSKSSGGETNGTTKRAKRGWALIRQSIKNRFTDKSKNASSSASVEQPSEPPSFASRNVLNPRPTIRATFRSSVNERGDVLRSAVGSLLFTMSNESTGTDLEREFEGRLHHNFLALLNARRDMRSLNRGNPRTGSNSDDADSDTKSKKEKVEEIPLPPDLFRKAILELPLPSSIKSYLLFYRTPN